MIAQAANQTSLHLALGLGLASFMGGQVIYSLYKMSQRSKKIQVKKNLLETERQRIINQEREGYERRIKELEQEVAKYKAKYQAMKKRVRVNFGVASGGENSTGSKSQIREQSKEEELIEDAMSDIRKTFAEQMKLLQSQVQSQLQKNEVGEIKSKIVNIEEKFSEVIAANGGKVMDSRIRTQSKEELKIDPNIMIARSIK